MYNKQLHDQIKQLCFQYIKDEKITEKEFLRRYTYGYMAAGNSAYDLLRMMYDGTIHELFTLDNLSKELADMDVPLDATREQILYYLQGYYNIRQRMNSTVE